MVKLSFKKKVILCCCFPNPSDKVREANGCVLIHCLGGVSRSATLAIAYIMKHMKMSSDEAYR